MFKNSRSANEKKNLYYFGNCKNSRSGNKKKRNLSYFEDCKNSTSVNENEIFLILDIVRIQEVLTFYWPTMYIVGSVDRVRLVYIYVQSDLAVHYPLHSHQFLSMERQSTIEIVKNLRYRYP